MSPDTPRRTGLEAACRSAVALTLLCWASALSAQLLAADENWKESDTPPPPALVLTGLLPLELPASTSMQFGVDPRSLSVGADGVVRYVVVAQSSSGVVNAMYEGLRCSTAEYKTYARAFGDGKWSTVPNAEWASLRTGRPSRHTSVLARDAACEGNTVRRNAREIIDQLKAPARNWQ